MEGGFDLRKARVDDLPALRALYRLSLAAHGAGHYSRAELAGFFADVEGVPAELIEDGTYSLIVDGARIVAAGGWTLRPSGLDRRTDAAGPVATIHGVFTHPDFAGLGLSRTLLDVVEAEAVVRGRAYRIELCAMLAEQGFYQRRGYFARDLVHMTLSNGAAFDAVRMEKRILADLRSRVARGQSASFACELAEPRRTRVHHVARSRLAA